jgi:tryptophan-rich sensory protein
VKAIAVATVICLIAVVLEAILAGSDPRSRFNQLRSPPYSPAFRVWVFIGLLYYVMCFLILRRILSSEASSLSNSWALALVVAILVFNALWNLLFFRLGALRVSFLVFIPYGLLVVALTILMISIYPFGTVLLTLYCGYLIYAMWWSYKLWQLNDSKH